MSTTNSLGLDLGQLSLQDSSEVADTIPKNPSEIKDATANASIAPSEPTTDQPADNQEKEKKKEKAYVNHERVNTGGTPRDKMSEEALSERMARIREQNEKIKQRRVDVKADEEAFRKTEEAERVRRAHNRKIQENVDRTREQNAQRKMDKAPTREWDQEKPTPSSGRGAHRGGASDRGGRGGLRKARGGGPDTQTSQPPTKPEPATSTSLTPAST